MPEIEVDVDGLPATIEAEWQSEIPAEVERVRAARAEVTDLTGVHEPADWDYTSLPEAFGEIGDER